METPQDLNQQDKWRQYYERTKDSKPRPLLKEVATLVDNKDEALDLGSGALNDTIYLISSGFNHVTAVDSTPVPTEIAEAVPSKKLSCVMSTFDNFNFQSSTYDLVNAQYSLPFNSSSTFNGMFERLKLSLKQGGMFAGNFFGKNDEWNTGQNDMTFLSKEEVAKIMEGFEILKLEEDEKDGKTASGISKHWHLINVIAKKL